MSQTQTTKASLVALLALAALLAGCFGSPGANPRPAAPTAYASPFRVQLGLPVTVPGDFGLSAVSGGQTTCIIVAFLGPSDLVRGNATLTWTPGPGGPGNLGVDVSRSDGKPGLAADGASPVTVKLDTLAPFAAGASLTVRPTGDSGVAPAIDQDAQLDFDLVGYGPTPDVRSASC